MSMTPQQARVIQAEADARAAHQRFNGSIAAVQSRLRPATLVREARREIVEARGSAIDVAIRRPKPVAIAAAAVAAVTLGGPLIGLLRRRRRRKPTYDY